MEETIPTYAEIRAQYDETLRLRADLVKLSEEETMAVAAFQALKAKEASLINALQSSAEKHNRMAKIREAHDKAPELREWLLPYMMENRRSLHYLKDVFPAAVAAGVKFVNKRTKRPTNNTNEAKSKLILDELLRLRDLSRVKVIKRGTYMATMAMKGESVLPAVIQQQLPMLARAQRLGTDDDYRRVGMEVVDELFAMTTSRLLHPDLEDMFYEKCRRDGLDPSGKRDIVEWCLAVSAQPGQKLVCFAKHNNSTNLSNSDCDFRYQRDGLSTTVIGALPGEVWEPRSSPDIYQHAFAIKFKRGRRLK